MNYKEFKDNEEELQKAISNALSKALDEIECPIYELDWFSSWAKKNIPSSNSEDVETVF